MAEGSTFRKRPSEVSTVSTPSVVISRYSVVSSPRGRSSVKSKSSEGMSQPYVDRSGLAGARLGRVVSECFEEQRCRGDGAQSEHGDPHAGLWEAGDHWAGEHEARHDRR